MPLIKEKVKVSRHSYLAIDVSQVLYPYFKITFAVSFLVSETRSSRLTT
jgi:hypothetical protein